MCIKVELSGVCRALSICTEVCMKELKVVFHSLEKPTVEKWFESTFCPDDVLWMLYFEPFMTEEKNA